MQNPSAEALAHTEGESFPSRTHSLSLSAIALINHLDDRWIPRLHAFRSARRCNPSEYTPSRSGMVCFPFWNVCLSLLAYRDADLDMNHLFGTYQ
mmetsp:Transcript_143726/g.250512  ORF Transcript_143726/g.250512 Transcript_143726/m.250512 type:complete len:95 (-) Transcript_143726:38-322(-)